MIQLDPADKALGGLVGEFLQSATRPEDRYQVVRSLNVQQAHVMLLALRESEGGMAPVVVKMITPYFASTAGSAASLFIQKEVDALRRLTEQTPPTPFVVRLIDNGSVHVQVGPSTLSLGWVAQEYVHGGAEGTDLVERVAYSIKTTGAAFDPLRAADAIRCLASGLEAIHAVDVVHRNLAPANVLCCGFGDREILKIANFGLARPGGMASTFHSAVGTPGYSAPEQLYAESTTRALPSSDVFGMATLVYYLLTGEAMFSFRSLPDMVTKLTRGERPKIRDAANLAPSLKDSPPACRALDEALAQATALDPEARFQSANELAEAVTKPLLSPRQLVRTTFDRLPTLSREQQPARESWQWSQRHQGWEHAVVRSAAFDGDGRCLAATDRGLAFWDGTLWRPALQQEDPELDAAGVTRSRAGEWLVAARSALYNYSSRGLEELARFNDPRVRFNLLSGHHRQSVAVGTNAHGQISLFVHTRRGWLDPYPIQATALPGIARFSASHWVLGGRDTQDNGFLALWTPLGDALEQLTVPRARAFISCSGDPDRNVALALGTGGIVVRYDGRQLKADTIPSETPLSVTSLDEGGGMWVGGVGTLWFRGPEPDASWQCVWNDSTHSTPLAAIHTQAGVILALSATGAVIEGSEPRA